MKDDLKSKRAPLICSICGEQYEGCGNNAQPVNDGRCCDMCDMTVVIPRRIVEMYRKGEY